MRKHRECSYGVTGQRVGSGRELVPNLGNRNGGQGFKRPLFSSVTAVGQRFLCRLSAISKMRREHFPLVSRMFVGDEDAVCKALRNRQPVPNQKDIS